MTPLLASRKDDESHTLDSEKRHSSSWILASCWAVGTSRTDSAAIRSSTPRASTCSATSGIEWGLAFDMIGVARGAKQPLDRPLDGRVRRLALNLQRNPSMSPVQFARPKVARQRDRALIF